MRKLQTKLQNFHDSCSGIAAVEFALILPILSVLVFGGYATFETVQNNRHVDRASSIIADLTSRLSIIDDDTADNLFDIAESLIGDASKDDSYAITFSSISNTFDTADKYELIVDWTFANKSSKELKDSDIEDFDIPHVPEGESVILVNIEVDYASLIFQDFIGVVNLDQASTRRPRFVPLVVYNK